MKTNYDLISWCYDGLSRLVFGNTLLKAQCGFLPTVPAGANVLIVGGGTGKLLEELVLSHAQGLTVTYIDSSVKMVAKARERDLGANQIVFAARRIEDVELKAGQFDVVVTPFFFDNFPEHEAASIFRQLDLSLKEGGTWLFTDFRDCDSLWLAMLLKIMYLFFRFSCGIAATRLPPTEAFFIDNQYTIEEEAFFYHQFICSRRYRKPTKIRATTPNNC